MKKINNKVIIIFLLLSGMLFCSFSKNTTKTVKGFVHVYGNEPFTYIGIETEDDKNYAISASEEEISKLWKTQGNLIEIEGYIIKPESEGRLPGMLKDGKIEVVEWKFVK